MSPALFAACRVRARFDQDLPHHAGRHRQEVFAAVEVRASQSEQADVSFIHQGGGLQGVRVALPTHLPGGQAAQLGLHYPHQLGSRLLVAVLETAKLQSHFGRLGCGMPIVLSHACQYTQCGGESLYRLLPRFP